MLRRPFSLLFFAQKETLRRGQLCIRLPGFWHHYSLHLPATSLPLLQRPLIMHKLWFKRETTFIPRKWKGYNLRSTLMINGLFALRMLYQITAYRHFILRVHNSCQSQRLGWRGWWKNSNHFGNYLIIFPETIGLLYFLRLTLTVKRIGLIVDSFHCILYEYYSLGVVITGWFLSYSLCELESHQPKHAKE